MTLINDVTLCFL